LINRLVQLARGKELALYRQKVRFEHAWTHQMYIYKGTHCPLPKMINSNKYQYRNIKERSRQSKRDVLGIDFIKAFPSNNLGLPKVSVK